MQPSKANDIQKLVYFSGLFVDWRHSKLYFANMDMVTLDGVAYAWHRVESVDLNTKGRRVVLTNVEQPRGLWVDMVQGWVDGERPWWRR